MTSTEVLAETERNTKLSFNIQVDFKLNFFGKANIMAPKGIAI